MRPAATRPKSSRLSSPAVASLGPGDIAAKREDRDVSALQHFRAPDGLAPGPGYSHAVTGRGRWVATSGQVALDGEGKLVGPGEGRGQTPPGFAHLHPVPAPASPRPTTFPSASRAQIRT